MRVYIYLEFVAFKAPSFYLLTYFFYRSFSKLKMKFNFIPIALLIVMILYVLPAPIAVEVRTYEHYFVGFYIHCWRRS
ncbi:hypothetical protein B6U71_01600 [Euryarchaeota archaeon ex4484_178]|nr:MAG: hypothetical protein B6U71_01600 [Euryarchaeota archaeon ex4484_178]